MSDSNPKPGKSLESDLRLIREANGLSREDIFNKVHIRPEVLAQVEEHGFTATPTLNSDIHRRSFVKHYADAVGIDSELALKALEMSVNGIYDGSLAVEYLGLEKLNPVPRWASAETSVDEAGDGSEAADSPARLSEVGSEPERPEPDESGPDVAASDQPAVEVPEPEVPEFDLPKAIDTPVFPVPEPEEQDEPDTPDSAEPVQETEPTPVRPISEASSPTPSDPVSLPESSDEPVSEVGKEAEVPPAPNEPEAPASPAQPVSPYAPPVGGRPIPETSRQESTPEAPPPPPPPPPSPDPPVPRRRRESATIPSSTMKESHIVPLEEDDYGDEQVSIFTRMRSRHALGWMGLIGVVVIILFFVGRAIYLNMGEEEEGARRIRSVEQLPQQFSGIVRLTPTTERFVTLQITPDSLSTTEFEYKMWTHNAGSTFAETGVGSLNGSNNQILLGEPYGIGGLFVLENGRYRLRSVRRVRFPRWEFTGHVTP